MMVCLPGLRSDQVRHLLAICVLDADTRSARVGGTDRAAQDGRGHWKKEGRPARGNRNGS